MKVKSLQEIVKITRNDKRKGRKIIFTNGCFDILHPGHIASLEWAKGKGDILIVGLNSDKSVRSIKGENRPIHKAKDRGDVLAGLSRVDYIVVFNDLTPANLLNKIKPNIYVKGKDATKYASFKKEKEIVEANGGKVFLAPMKSGYSTSKIIASILKRNK